jgi:outer membrane protein OmpA-like peptidoglycan-associated protein
VGIISSRSIPVFALAAVVLPAGLSAQPQSSPDANILVEGQRLTGMPQGPEIKGIITARSGGRIQVAAADGTRTTIAIDEATRIRGGGGLFGGNRDQPTAASLLPGLPVTVKTWQSTAGLIANQISFRSNDLKTARMIHGGTNQRFEEQAAATEALRGRMGDIDKYNIKSTTNVYFDTGKWALSERAKADLCAAATTAEGVDNALMLVVGYTDSTGSQELNQTLSEKRAGGVINYLQQACHWKPYRMLTPTGMASADPAADNSTAAGKAQNRRVSVNVLVSKGLDGM